LHERIGRSLYLDGFRELPGINHTDDVILLALAAVSLVGGVALLA